jgi:hypothetical protein
MIVKQAFSCMSDRAMIADLSVGEEMPLPDIGDLLIISSAHPARQDDLAALQLHPGRPGSWARPIGRARAEETGYER